MQFMPFFSNHKKIEMAVFWRIIYIVFILLYPFAIFFCIKFFEPRFISILFIAIILFYSFQRKSTNLFRIQRIFTIILCLILFVLSQIYNEILYIKLYPVFVNLFLFTLFSFTLFFPPSMIEVFARIKDKILPPEAIIYTRNVTKIWCGFFIFNATTSLYTTLYSSFETWTIYNGFIVYFLIALLFISEYLFRVFVVRRKK